MRKVLNISDDSGFLGLANLSEYQSFISPSWNFETLKKRIVEQTNKNNILFWATGREDNWQVQIIINEEDSEEEFFRNEEALIEVTNNKLYLVNYETLSMAAQFEHVKLPEKHLSELYIEIENGVYLVEFRQVNKPVEIVNRKEIDFEIRLEKVDDISEYFPNNFVNIFWNIY